jgi:hypothetical protein
MTRLTRTYVQRIEARAEEVFPLLCPVREKEWLPGWDCRMIYSRSGVAERGAVFETAHAQGLTLWVMTEHIPSHRIEFTRWQPDGLLVSIEIELGRHHEGDTAVCIAYTYTAVNDQGQAALASLGEADWLRQMTYWESSMNAWLKKKH